MSRIFSCDVCGEQAVGRYAPQRYCSLPCRKLAHQWHKYGLQAADYHAIVEAQGGNCGACGERLTGRVSVDHCHESGRVRGVVHQRCNVGLGQARSDSETLWRWGVYLARAEFDLRDLCAA